MKQKIHPVGFCIYCGAAGVKLEVEHTVPYAMNGDLELPAASCTQCARTFNKEVENRLLQGPLWPFRARLGLRSRSKRPTHLPGYVWENGEQAEPTLIGIPTDEYPGVIRLFHFGAPRLLGGEPARGGYWQYTLDMDALDALLKKHAPHIIGPPPIDAVTLCRFLAKMAHATAVAGIGFENFVPVVRKLILSDCELDPFDYVGGFNQRLPRGDVLHEITFDWESVSGTEYLVARLRLFAQFSGPLYYIVVGTRPQWNDRASAHKYWTQPVTYKKSEDKIMSRVLDITSVVPGVGTISRRTRKF